MNYFEIPELKTVLAKLESIEKSVLENWTPEWLSASMTAEKYDIDKQTLDSAAKEKLIKKRKFKNRVYFSPKSIDKAIADGEIKPFNPKPLKK